MKAVRLGELRELLESTAFGAWWTEWQRATAALGDARLRHADLVAQAELMSLRSEIAQRAAVAAFSRSGEVEEEGTRFTTEAQGHENRALTLVAEFERRKALDGEGEGPRRKDLWDDVEAAWAASLERSLLGAEHAVLARRVRRDAERLFGEAEERRARSRRLTGDADGAQRELREADLRLGALRAAARERFGCVAGPSFLYWRRQDDARSAFAVSLGAAEDADVPVKPLGIYVVGRQRGVASLEPAR